MVDLKFQAISPTTSDIHPRISAAAHLSKVALTATPSYAVAMNTEY
jgi:hypothetical protein